MGYYDKEKEPKGTKASDSTGEKRVGASKVDKEKFMPGVSGEKIPKKALSSDTSGERKMPIMGGVGMGKADSMGSREASHMGHHDGRMGEMKGMVTEKSVYDHKRYEHDQDSM